VRLASSARKRELEVMNNNSFRRALVTGASSGIGAAYARALASLKCDVVLIARREERLNSLALELREQHHVEAEVLAADLVQPYGLERIEKRIADLVDLDMLVNCAGFEDFGKFVELPLDNHLKLIDIHIIASVRLCRAAVPGMIQRGRGAIVNVSSIGAFTPKPYDVTYCAAKAYLNTFSLGLQAELYDTGVRVQALCPGLTRTEFHDRLRIEKPAIIDRLPTALWMTPEEVVSESLKCLERGRTICVPGFKNRFIVALARSGITDMLMKMLLSFRKKLDTSSD
jgi:short-subunit dehydrogenase